jgi:tetratricopeptide (TPR) repeat protein
MAGCSRASGPCRQAIQARHDEEIATRCAEAFSRSHDPESGLAAVKALAALERVEPAIALAGQLAATPVEGRAAVELGELLVRTRAREGRAFLEGALGRIDAGKHPGEAAAVARQLGRLAWADTRYQDALEAFDRSLVHARAARDQELTYNALRGVFTMLYEMGDLRGAAATLREASANVPGTDPRAAVLNAFDRGMLADAEGHRDTALAAFTEVATHPAVKSRPDFAWNATLNILSIALDTGDLPRASRAHQQAQEMFHRDGFDKRASSRIALAQDSARLAREQGDPTRALQLLAATAADKPSEGWAWSLALERGRALAALGRLPEAIAAFEESAAIVDKLRGDQADDFKSWVIARRRAPFVALFEAQAARGDAEAALAVVERTQGQTFLEAFAASTQAAGRADLTRRVEWLKRLYPALRASPMLTAAPAASARPPLPPDRAAVVFFEGRDRLFAVSVAGKRARIFTLSPPLAQLRSLAARLLADPGDAASAQALGGALFPRGSLPPAGGTVYLVPSTALARLPFAALRPQGRWLVEDHVLAQVPTLRALAAVRPRARPPEAAPALVLANASGDLPEAQAEGGQVAALLGGAAAARLYTGAEATSARLREGVGAAVLHLALHSGVGPTGPWLGLADRQVLASELVDWRLSPELVVLASCASAATPDPGLWGSLVASFLASGSPAVLGSLWSTEDRTSRELVLDFHRNGSRDDPAAALARTQRAWLKQGRPPRQWAAFAFYGPGRAEAVATPPVAARGGRQAR